MKLKTDLQKSTSSWNTRALIGVSMVVGLAMGGGWLFWQKNLQSQRKVQIKKSNQESSKLDEAKDDYLQHLHKKIKFIASLAEKSNEAHSNKELTGQLKWLSEIKLSSQDDFDRIEVLQSQIGDRVVAEIQCFQAKKNCLLISSFDTVRELERLDRAIDQSRLALSRVTYKLSQLEKGITSSPSSSKKAPSKGFIPHFKVDHLILGQK